MRLRSFPSASFENIGSPIVFMADIIPNRGGVLGMAFQERRAGAKKEARGGRKPLRVAFRLHDVPYYENV
jgi:hypothetical protein